MSCVTAAHIAGIAEGDDPWLAGYLRLRQAVLDGELATQDEITAYAAELRCSLPDHHPPPPTAAFIAADIKITFPLPADQLWTPRPR